jgi:hypothetical protein
MTEEIQEIERLIKQSGELADSLIRLARKLQERSQQQLEPNQANSERLATLLKQLTNLAACSGEVLHEIDNEQTRQQDKAYVTMRSMVANGTVSPQEAAVTLLQVQVIHHTMTPADATEQLVKLLQPDLSVSQRIQIRETAKAAFEAREDVLSKIKPFLKGAQQEQQQRKQQMSQGKTMASAP